MCDPATLEQNFGISGIVEFRTSDHGAVLAQIDNAQATASLARQGAQLLTWAPTGQPPVVWLSPAARFTAGKSLRGGAPVCWPWFGAHPDDAAKPAHGFARNIDWKIVETARLRDVTRIMLRLLPEPAQCALWPHSAELTLTVTVGERLRLELTTRNTGADDFRLTQALHTYFHVGDIGATRIEGLDGKTYVDRAAGDARVVQDGPVIVRGEVDRIYLDCPGETTIVDEALQRCIRIGKQGSRSCVVWNPWADKGAKLGDMGEDGYRHMVCVETCNAWDDVVDVAAGTEYTLSTEYSVEPIRALE
jgi:D-hexose-6-phosphate mutarotase